MTTNDPDHPAETLACEAKVLFPLRVTPRRLDFGRVHHYGPTPTVTASIVRGDGGPIAPEVLATAYPGIVARLKEVEPGERYELEVSISRRLPEGNFKHLLRIGTGVAEVPEVRIPLAGNVVPLLDVRPRIFTFPPKRAVESTKTVELRWDRLEPGKVLTAETTFPDASIRVEKGKHGQRITLTLPAGPRVGGRIPDVTITTDDPEIPTLAIPIRFEDPSTAKKSSPRGKSKRNKGMLHSKTREKRLRSRSARP